MSHSYIDPISLLPNNKLLDDPILEAEVSKKMLPVTDHSGHRVWQCTECDYRVKNSNDLRKHVERKHLMCEVVCDLCNESFNCRYRLQQHNRKFHSELY